MPSASAPLTIVGGTYGESCAFPRYSEIFGSGLRAAAALASSGVQITLHTAASEALAKNAEMKAATFGFSLVVVPISAGLWFSYFHTLSGGNLSPNEPGKFATIEVAAERILHFGMLDARVVVRGGTVVYDPQAPAHPHSFRKTGSTANRLAIVLNRREAFGLSGERDIVVAAKAILALEKAEVVVVKDGPRGALVVDAAGENWVPSFPSPKTFLIGSGDIFSAVFAREWAIFETMPVEAARRASIATASWCSTGALPIVEDLTKLGFSARTYIPTAIAPKVYLAGPFFNVSQLWWVSHVREVLTDLGLKVFSPFHDVGIAAKENGDVAAKDLKGLLESDVVFALLDGFDPGTLFEVGYARREGIPVIGLQTQGDIRTHETMLSGTGCLLCDDFGTAAYHTAWTAPRSR